MNNREKIHVHRLRITLAQINVTVGDLQGNVARILANVGAAKAQGADLVAFPELAIPGYPPEDLLLKPQFVEANLAALDEVAAAAQDILVVVGFADRQDDIYNAAAICHQGQVAGVYRKQFLPNYSVFDEDRYFQAGCEAPVFCWGEATFGINICEDIWYPGGPTKAQAFLGGAQLIVNISASPYHIEKGRFRERMLATRATDNTAIVAFCNLVGGQDELVFDGQSLIFDAQGALLARGAAFEEDLVLADLDLEVVFNRRLHDPRRRKQTLVAEGSVPRISLPGLPPFDSPSTGLRTRLRTPPQDQKPELAPREAKPLEPLEEIYRALALGTGDYVHKNGFQTVIIALSGGIDSSLTAAIAADALGPEQVVGVRMPSRYTSDMSNDDAANWRPTWASGCSPFPSSPLSTPTSICWPSPFPAPSPAWPRRTSRLASGATS
jgi:NAD+ synthase (glutamine-hydrolysing)